MISSRIPTLDVNVAPSPITSARSHARNDPFRAILVAPPESRDAHSEALRAASGMQVRFAANYRDLWLIPAMQQLRLAVLSDALPSFELEASCRLIRRRSRTARILILHSRPCSIETALYDDRVASSITPQQLRATVLRLLGKRPSED